MRSDKPARDQARVAAVPKAARSKDQLAAGVTVAFAAARDAAADAQEAAGVLLAASARAAVATNVAYTADTTAGAVVDRAVQIQKEVTTSLADAEDAAAAEAKAVRIQNCASADLIAAERTAAILLADAEVYALDALGETPADSREAVSYRVMCEDSGAVVIHEATCGKLNGELVGTRPTYLDAKDWADTYRKLGTFNCPVCCPESN